MTGTSGWRAKCSWTTPGASQLHLELLTVAEEVIGGLRRALRETDLVPGSDEVKRDVTLGHLAGEPIQMAGAQALNGRATRRARRPSTRSRVAGHSASPGGQRR